MAPLGLFQPGFSGGEEQVPAYILATQPRLYPQGSNTYWRPTHTVSQMNPTSGLACLVYGLLRPSPNERSPPSFLPCVRSCNPPKRLGIPRVGPYWRAV